MKFSIVFLFVCFQFAGLAETLPMNYYVVVSDQHDPQVKPNTCLLVGKIMDIYEQPVAGGIISNLDRSRSCVSDTKGNYSMVLSSKDTAVFFYHENYGEIIIWSYPFKSHHRTEINFITMEKTEFPIVQEKPVIYLYSETPTTVDLSLDHPGITFTYPAYNNGWQVTATRDGIINSVDGKNYPYLFWEGKQNGLTYQKTNGKINGSVISSNVAISFLENVLTQVGLNAKEQTDFITYWGPRLSEHPFAFVQFLVDEEVDQSICHLNVVPKPDAQRRVYMLYTPLQNANVPFAYEAQKWVGFERKGFTLLEWGGSEISFDLIQP